MSLALPMLWLKSKVRTRQSEIGLGLPDALDMLSVCASAGLGFDQSLQKISSYWDTELGAELKRVTQEMELGISRSEALRNMSGRLCVDDLTQFIAIIIQAEKIGSATRMSCTARQRKCAFSGICGRKKLPTDYPLK